MGEYALAKYVTSSTPHLTLLLTVVARLLTVYVFLSLFLATRMSKRYTST